MSADVNEIADGGKKSAATMLVELALQHYSLHTTETGEAFAVPHEGANHVARRIRGGRQSMRAELAKLFYSTTGKTAPQQGLADAVLTLEGLAQDADPEILHLRVAESHEALWVDMGDVAGHVIKITAGTFAVVEHAPVLFHRTALTVAMPTPKADGDIAELWEFLNVDAADKPLLVAALVASFLPDIPHPIPTMTGEQGTGKSTTTRMLVDLIDPSSVPLRKPPRDAEGWVTAASGSWCVAVDNLSTVQDWFSDSLCRAVTGDGDVRRALYTDGGLAVFAFRRQVMLTGIDFAGLRGDLAERLVLIQLNRIDDRHRKDERELDARWREARPRIFGALLGIVARAYQVFPSLRLDEKPRMADFARVLKAVDQVMGTDGYGRYMSQAREIAADTLTASSFVQLLMESVTDFEGTAAELLDQVAPDESGWRAPRDWPRNPRAVTTVLKRDAPALRKNGWTVDDLGANRDHATIWRVTHPEIAGISTSPTSHSSQDATYASDESNVYGQSQDALAVAVGQKQAGATCPKHGTPTYQGLCGRCEAEKVSA